MITTANKLNENGAFTLDAHAFFAEQVSFNNSNGNDEIIENGNFQSLFKKKTANSWIDEAMLKPLPKTLFGEFWYEGEVCVLFSDTGAGKSLLSVQIADSLTRHQPLGFFSLKAEPQKVLYFDFELSERQFARRYAVVEEETRLVNPFRFSENFFRLEINPHGDFPNAFLSFEDYLKFSLERAVAESEAKVLILDNITWLTADTQKGVEAITLMKYLQSLQAKFDLSLKVLAHTPKRDETRPLTLNDLGGSRHIANFADIIFAIGKSCRDKNLRYLKQFKPRNGELLYGEDCVCVCQITKSDNFTRFEFLSFGSEREHLKTLTDDDRTDLKERAKQLREQGRTQREIANELGIAPSTVNKYLNLNK